MSLPRELLDELLSRYIDGDLSNDERHRVEKLLADDDLARASYEQIKQQSAALQRLLASTPKLGDGFASRVVTAAIDEAIRESLPGEHPVRLAGERGGAGEGLSRRFSRQRLVAVLALAATVVFVVVSLRGWRTDNEVGQPMGTEVATNIAPDKPATSDEPVTSDEPQLAQRMLADPNIPAATPEGIASDAAAPENTAAENVTPSNSSMLADNGVGAGAEAAVTDPLVGLDPNNLENLSLQAVFVFEIEVTTAGREQNVVGRLFRESGIVEAERKEVDEALVGYLQAGQLISADEDSTQSNNEVSVVFLEGSGLKLERLMMDFVEAEGEIARVGFNIAFDAPVAAAVSTLGDEVDVTKIRQPESAAEPTGLVAQRLVRDEANGSFVSGSLPFQPLKQESVEMLRQLQPTTGNTPDITTQVLLLIRQVP